MSSRKTKGSLLATALLAIVLGSSGVALLFLARTAEAQQEPFLISPYYGSEIRTAYFDHKYPTYGSPPNNSYPEVVIYTGASSGSCDPYCYDGHNGIDFGLYYERVLAAASGQVERARWWDPNYRSGSLSGLGLHIRIDHANGYQTRYGHLSVAAVAVDQQVLSGQVIGTSGNTGNSTGPHLHFEVRHNLTAVDPFGWSGGYTDPWQSWSGEASLCLWTDGEWADVCGGISRPIPAPADGTTIIVDDQDSGFSKGCAAGSPCPYWYEAAAGYNNHMWWTYDNDNLEDYWARWNPSIPQQGIYEVYVHVPNVNATTWQAPYTISHYDGQNTAVVDQNGLNNQWVSIGVYRFHQGTADSVRVTDATGELYVLRKLGVDAVKFVRRAPTYLPDVRINNSNWNAKVVIRSNGGNAFVDVKFYNQSGTLQATQTNSDLAGHGVWEVPLPGLSNFTGAAVIDASQDVAVVVENLKSGEATNYQGVTPAGGLGNAGWGQTGTTIYVPIFKYNWYPPNGRSGDLYVQNVGNAPAHVDLTLYQSLPEDEHVGDSFHDPTWQRTVDINGRTIYRATQLGIPTDRVYSALLTSDQPLAVVTIEHQSDDTGQASANGFSSGTTTGYVPLVKKNWYPNNTGTSVQNLDNGYTYTRVDFYEEDDTPDPYDPSTGWQGLPAYTTRVYYSPNYLPSANNYLGSAIAHSSSSPAAVLVHEAGNGVYMMHNGFLAGTDTVILPRVYKPDPDKSTVPWTTGIQVQNVGGALANVTIQYYDQNGTPAATDGDSIASNRAQVFWQGDASDPLPSPFVGSAVITSDQPIVAVVNVARGGSGDTGMSYSGFNR